MTPPYDRMDEGVPCYYCYEPIPPEYDNRDSVVCPNCDGEHDPETRGGRTTRIADVQVKNEMTDADAARLKHVLKEVGYNIDVKGEIPAVGAGQASIRLYRNHYQPADED